MENKKDQPDKEIAQVALSTVFYGNGAKDQCARFLQALNRFKINTDEASRFLGIYHQSARASELGKHSHSINMVLENVEAENGILHRVGCSVLRGGHSD